MYVIVLLGVVADSAFGFVAGSAFGLAVAGGSVAGGVAAVAGADLVAGLAVVAVVLLAGSAGVAAMTLLGGFAGVCGSVGAGGLLGWTGGAKGVNWPLSGSNGYCCLHQTLWLKLSSWSMANLSMDSLACSIISQKGRPPNRPGGPPPVSK